MTENVRKAFGHAVMEKMMTLIKDGQGPAVCGFGIVVLIVITP